MINSFYFMIVNILHLFPFFFLHVWCVATVQNKWTITKSFYLLINM